MFTVLFQVSIPLFHVLLLCFPRSSINPCSLFSILLKSTCTVLISKMWKKLPSWAAYEKLKGSSVLTKYMPRTTSMALHCNSLGVKSTFLFRVPAHKKRQYVSNSHSSEKKKKIFWPQFQTMFGIRLTWLHDLSTSKEKRFSRDELAVLYLAQSVTFLILALSSLISGGGCSVIFLAGFCSSPCVSSFSLLKNVRKKLWQKLDNEKVKNVLLKAQYWQSEVYSSPRNEKNAIAARKCEPESIKSHSLLGAPRHFIIIEYCVEILFGVHVDCHFLGYALRVLGLHCLHQQKILVKK